MNCKTFAVATLATLGLYALSPPAHGQGIESHPTGVEQMAPEMKASQRASNGWLGVMLDDPEGDATGVLVTRVLRSSPAKEAGVQKDDRILRIGDDRVESVAAVQKRIRRQTPGEETTVEIARGDEKHRLEVTLKQSPTPQTLVEREFVDRRAPDFSARVVGGSDELDGGEEIDRETFSGKPLVIDFWATWCAPCRPVSKKLNELNEEVGERVQFVGLSSDPPEKVEAHLEEHGSNFPLARAEETVMESFLIESYPSLYVLDSEGRVAGVFLGSGHHRAVRELVLELVDD